ncbi:hypothetical protein HK102_008453 [Quaeritorhiza haematococci]|nr:hypothetical protein HK102_008453 [Quaeritorhiza haematococci]
MPKVTKKKEDRDSSRVPRKPSKYNEFLKTEITKVKKEQPTLTHREAFKIAASRWKTAPENPNREKDTKEKEKEKEES